MGKKMNFLFTQNKYLGLEKLGSHNHKGSESILIAKQSNSLPIKHKTKCFSTLSDSDSFKERKVIDMTRTLHTNKVIAVAKFIRRAPTKVRRVLYNIRGRTYEEALMILEFMPYRSCEPIIKCLRPAASNAKENSKMKKNKLYVHGASCDMGTVLRRYRFRARGRGYRIKKPMCRITITVAEL